MSGETDQRVYVEEKNHSRSGTGQAFSPPSTTDGRTGTARTHVNRSGNDLSPTLLSAGTDYTMFPAAVAAAAAAI